MAAGDLGFDGDVVLELSRLEVDIDHLAGTETSLLDDVRLIEVDDTCLRHHVHSAIASDTVSGRAETVAVEASADGLAITVYQERAGPSQASSKPPWNL